jgi:hypothetical protein
MEMAIACIETLSDRFFREMARPIWLFRIGSLKGEIQGYMNMPKIFRKQISESPRTAHLRLTHHVWPGAIQK